MDTEIGLLHVRRSIFINASTDKVWHEFTTLERLRAWLGTGQFIHQFELEIGAQIDLSIEIEGDARHFGGAVIVIEKAKELSFEIQWQGPFAWPVPTYWTLKLKPVNDGCSVEIFHHGFERIGENAADNLQGYEEGWSVQHLTALRAIVEGHVE